MLPISSIPPWSSARNFTTEANAHNHRNISAEQNVSWQEQGRHTLNFQQAGFERADQEYEQAARGEVRDAVAQATEMSRVEMRETIGCSRKSSRVNLDVSSSFIVERDEQFRKRRAGKSEKKCGQ